MKGILSVDLLCPRRGPVTLETRNWSIEGDGAEERIHYHVNCVCGSEHFGFGFTKESLALSQA